VTNLKNKSPDHHGWIGTSVWWTCDKMI